MRILFAVHARTRGGLNQAVAARQMLERGGHEICGVLVVKDGKSETPEFFWSHFADVKCNEVDSFRYQNSLLNNTLAVLNLLWFLLNIPVLFFKWIPHVDAYIRQQQPDLILNFGEPLIGFWKWRFGKDTPVISIGTLYSYFHPQFHAPNVTNWIQRAFHHSIARIAGFRSYCWIGLSYRELRHWKQTSLYIMPPFIRDEVRNLDAGRRNGLMVQIGDQWSTADFVSWYWRNGPKNLKATCFVPKEHVSSTGCGTIHLVDQDSDSFLDKLADCDGIVSHGGFDLIAEAMYLGKPIGIFPHPRDYSQQVTASIAMWKGAGIVLDKYDDITYFVPYLQRYRPNQDFVEWVDSGEQFLNDLLEGVQDEHHRAVQWTNRCDKSMGNIGLPVKIGNDETTI